jgi:RsiW-degrading membrane proteinase PrsW (M82 family)
MVGSELALVGGLVLFVGLAWLIEQAANLQDLRLSPLAALIMAAIPAGLWLAFFYLQDRHEPEPKHYVIGVFILGALVAAPLADFLIYQVAPPLPLAQHGLDPFTGDRLVRALLVVGLATTTSCRRWAAGCSSRSAPLAR